MSLPTCREELKYWALRKLGYPVLKINVDDEQLEDRLCEALDYFHQFHGDGTEKLFLRHKVTASSLTFDAALVGKIPSGGKITGQTSGAEGFVIDQADDDLSLRFQYKDGLLVEDTTTITTVQFEEGEVIENDGATITGTISAGGYIVGDLDNRFITVPEDIIAVTNIFPVGSSISGDAHIFDVRYQFALNNIHDLVSSRSGFGSTLVDYTNTLRHFELLEQLFIGFKPLRFNRLQQRIYIDFDWDVDAIVDSFLVFEVYAALDVDSFTKTFGDIWLRKYTTALFKCQWGANLIKFGGMQLPGGIVFNGQTIYDQAIQEIKDLEEEIEKKWQLPVDFIVG